MPKFTQRPAYTVTSFSHTRKFSVADVVFNDLRLSCGTAVAFAF